jgi:predicted GNAT family acetyltransferase
VGSIRYEVLADGIAYISRFDVKLDIQKSGVGRALVDAVEEEARKEGESVITLHTAAKMTCYSPYFLALCS